MIKPAPPGAARRAEVIAVLGGGALLCGSWVVVALEDAVLPIEARLFDVINDLPSALWPLAWPPMQLGSLVGSVVVVAGTQVIGRNWRLTLAALVGSQVAWWSGKIVKTLVARGRPAALLTGVHLRERASGLGYVSGHAAVAFALATVLAPSLPRPWRPVAFATALLVAVCRIYAGAHLPLDVIGGAGLGIISGTLARWAFGLGGEGLPVTDGNPT